MAHSDFMKTIHLVLALACVTTASTAEAHNQCELTAGAGYRLPFGVDMGSEDADGNFLEDGRLSFEGAPIFTGIAGYRIQRDGFVYLSYTRGVHTIHYEGEQANVGYDFSGSRVIEFYHFGGNIEMTRGRFVPYMGFSLGLGRIASTTGGDGRLFFAPVLDPGLKIDLHKHIHLRLMARVPHTSITEVSQTRHRRLLTSSPSGHARFSFLAFGQTEQAVREHSR
jgi:hypothetical protein